MNRKNRVPEFFLIASLFFVVIMIAISNQSEKQLVYLFSHGLAATHKQSDLFISSKNRNGQYIINDPLYTFDYPDVTENFWRINFLKSSLGQRSDVDALRNEYSKAVEIYPQAEFIIIGVSRGASTAINFCAMDQPEKVKALILESPFDSIDSVIKNLNKKLYLDSWKIFNNLSMKITEFLFKKFKKNGFIPLDFVHLLPNAMPILIIASKEDILIPWSSSYNLYEKLKNSGHNNAFFVLLNHGKHGFLFIGADATHYEAAVHAFYKKYGFIHDEDKAIKGMTLLEKTPNFDRNAPQNRY